MIWLLAHRGMSTKLLASPYTETAIDGAHSLVYSPGVEPIRYAGLSAPQGPLGTYGRGLHRASGFVFSFDADAAEKLLGIDDQIELILYYLSGRNQHRKRRLVDLVFAGDATVTVSSINTGVGELIGVPFRVNIPDDESLDDHIVDELD